MLLCVALAAKAQETKKEYDADALDEAGLREYIEPNQKVCFDKRIQFKARYGGREVTGCFLVNTKIGITAALPPETGASVDCELKVNNKKFFLFVFGMKGNEYTYFNRLEKRRQTEAGEVKHYVRTGNTHKNPMEDVLDNKMLYKKNGIAEFCNGKYKAFEYKSADEKDVLYLYGKVFPDELKAYSYLGAYGLGFMKTDKGNYLIMQATHIRDQIRMMEFEDIGESMDCFDPSVFQVYEETKVVEELAATEERRRTLSNQLAKDVEAAESGKYACATKKALWTDEKLKQTEKAKEMQEKVRDNTARFSRENDMVEFASNYDPIASVRMERLETEYKLCQLKNDIDNNRIANNNLGKAIEKANCWETRVSEYKKLEEGMDAIANTYRGDKKKMIEEKMKYYKDEVMPKIGQTRCK
jgi:hypothetical protein